MSVVIDNYKNIKESVSDWNKKDEAEKNSVICLSFSLQGCSNCPLNYKTESGTCNGKDSLYPYLESLSLAESIGSSIDRLKNEDGSIDSENANNAESLTRLQKSYIDKCNRIKRSLSHKTIHPVNEDHIPEPALEPEVVLEAPKRPHRVWTEEQKARAVEARRKTWEAKKRAAQMKEAKEVSAAVVKEEPKSEQQADRLDIARAIIDKRLEMAQDKVKSIEDKIQSLKDEGVELECVMPDFGRNELTHDKEVLEEALEIIKKYLEL